MTCKAVESLHSTQQALVMACPCRQIMKNKHQKHVCCCDRYHCRTRDQPAAALTDTESGDTATVLFVDISRKMAANSSQIAVGAVELA